MERKQRIECLRDIFTLIHPELVVKRKTPKGRKEHEERRDRMQAWLNDMVHTTAKEENPWSGQDKMVTGHLNLLPRFMCLLRECILSHRWSQVLAMLNCISHIPYGADWLIWKATLTALYTEPENNVSFIQEFFKHSYLLKRINVLDVALEFALYLINQGLTQEASQIIQTARKPKQGPRSEHQRELIEYTMTLLDGYQGLVFYIDWKTAINKKVESSQNSQSDSFYSLTSSQGLSDEAIKNIADRATLGLDSILHKSGVWDIFLAKSIEIHEYYEEFEEAEGLLCMYRDRNPDNPNAHRFLYEYLTRNSAYYDGTSANEESVNCLKSVAKLDPANPLVLTLWQKLTDGGKSGQALRCVFDLLDHEIWREKTEGWRCLAQSLTSSFSKERSEEEKKAVRIVLSACWSCRQDWWPLYHFTDSSATNADQTSSDQLMTSKIVAAAVLIGQDCRFNREAKKALGACSLQLLDGVLSDLDWDVIARLAELPESPGRDVEEVQVRESQRPSTTSTSVVNEDNARTSTPSSCQSTRWRKGNKYNCSLTDADMTSQFTEQSGSPGSQRLSTVSTSFVSKNNARTSTPSSSQSTRRKKGKKNNSSFTDADTRCPDSPEMKSPPRTRSANRASTVHKRISPPPSFVSPDDGHFSDISVELSSESSVHFSSSDLSSSESDSEDNRRHKQAKRKKKCTKTRNSVHKNLQKSTVSNSSKVYTFQKSEVSNVETFESTASTSTQRGKRKRRAEDDDDVDCAPQKRKRTEQKTKM